MENEYLDYKIKHIVSLNKNIMENKFFIMNIENQEYLFHIVRVATEIIELNGYIFSDELPIPIYSDSIYDSIYYSYHFLTLNFEEIEHANLIITPLGIFSLDLNIHITFKEIDNEETPLTKKLKYLILNDYEPTIYKNKEKLNEKQIDYQKALNKREELLKEIKNFEREREEKWKKIEKMLNSNAPTKKDPYEKFKDDLKRHKI